MGANVRRSDAAAAHILALLLCAVFCTAISSAARAEDDVLGSGLDFATLFRQVIRIRPRIHLDSRASPNGDLDNSQVSWVRTGVRVRVPLPFSKRLALQLTTGARYVGFDFSGDGGLSNGAPSGSTFDDFVGTEFRLGGRYLLDGEWALLAMGFATSRFEWGADFGDGVRVGGTVAFARQFFDRVTLALGVGLRSRLNEGGVSVEPYVQGEWKINNTWRLETQGTGLRLTAKTSEAFRVFAFAAFNSDRYRLKDRGTGVGKGSLRHRRVPVGLGFEWRSKPWLRVGGDVGAIAWQQFRVYDDDDDRVDTVSSDGPAALFSLSARLKF